MNEQGSRLSNETEFHAYMQWQFFTQWRALKAHANARGIQIIGDIPIFVAYDSADVWANHAFFELDAQGNPTVVAGVPPDYFSATGQRWGNPLYRWDVLAERGVERLLQVYNGEGKDHLIMHDSPGKNQGSIAYNLSFLEEPPYTLTFSPFHSGKQEPGYSGDTLTDQS